MDSERVQDVDGLWQTRTTLSPLPMVKKSTHVPIPESELNRMPSQEELRIAESNAIAKRRSIEKDERIYERLRRESARLGTDP